MRYKIITIWHWKKIKEVIIIYVMCFWLLAFINMFIEIKSFVVILSSTGLGIIVFLKFKCYSFKKVKERD